MPSEAKTPEQKVRRYLQRMREIRGGNPVDEASYYGALEELLNAVGGELKPKVVAVPQPRQSGHGQPDFGLCTADQIKRGARRGGGAEKPARGAVEVKGLAADLGALVRAPQTAKYLAGYGTLLLTNYRAFAVAERDAAGRPVIREARAVADNEGEFWNSHARIPREHGPALCEFLRRAMSRNAPIAGAEDVANMLASYAREAAAVLEHRSAADLDSLRNALAAALGLRFDGRDGEHFFRSTLVQTIFYGIFSAWMEHAGDRPFDWKSAAFAVKTPVVRTLFSEIVRPVSIGDLGIRPLLDAAAAALNRVEGETALFHKMGAHDAIQNFYEPFLAAFDPGLRKELGVWYTPPEIVRYMVRRVDQVLKTELQVADGLADEKVRVLDPCVGTGAYLAETLRVIRDELQRRGHGRAMAARGMKRAAMHRVFGFEILPASFVVAHWQIGALLAAAGAPLEDDERAAVYLTNALTGWEREAQGGIPFRELAEERAAAGRVKQEEPILVVMGNPPYNAFAGKPPAEEGGLVAPYLEGLYEKWGISRHSLNDLYVRFFRVAERRVVKNGRGVVCLISNHSYVRKPSFVVMRQKLLAEFDRAWIDNLNGSAFAGRVAPDGSPDPSVFAAGMNPGGIQVGTAIGLFARKGPTRRAAVARYRDFWGEGKRAALEESLKARDFNGQYERADPRAANRYRLRPAGDGRDYGRWPSLADWAEEVNGKKLVFNGPMERRGMSLIPFPDRIPAMLKALAAYLDPEQSDAEVARLEPRFMLSSGEYNAPRDRAMLLKRRRANSRTRLQADAEKVAPYPFKPFDLRAAYLDRDIAPLFSRPSPELLAQRGGGNWFLISRDYCDRLDEGVPVMASRRVCDYSVLGKGLHFPVWHAWRENGTVKRAANLSRAARKYLAGLGVRDADGPAAELLWLHALAVGWAPEYLRENAEELRDDWPRVPPPKTRAALERSARLGREVMRLLEADVPVRGVDAGTPPARLRMLARVQSSGPADLRVSAGARKIEPRAWTAREAAALTAGQRRRLGGAVDVYLNDNTFWSGVPAAAWDFRIGGHQAAKSWLSYRKESTLGRPLRDDEALAFAAMIRRLTELILLSEKLDANYRACRDAATPAM